MTNILGLSFFYHDSAAALVQDGLLVAAGEEERFSRKKHDHGFPTLAIDFCLAKAGITKKDIDYVVFYEKPFVKLERILLSSMATFPRSMSVFRESMLTWLTDKLWIKSMMKEKLGNRPQQDPLRRSPHVARGGELLLLAVRGVGDPHGRRRGRVDHRHPRLRQAEPHHDHPRDALPALDRDCCIRRSPHSCGFEVNEGEYKLMGMAPYGKPKYVEKIKQVIQIAEDGSLWHDMSYFAYHWSPESTLAKRFEEVFGKPRDPARADKHMDEYYADIAASIQVVTEEILITMAKHLKKTTGMKNICISGGVGLNCVANWKVLLASGFERMYVQPAAGDDGAAVGAAFWAWNDLAWQQKALRHGARLLGLRVPDSRVHDFVKTLGPGSGAKWEELSEDKAIDRTVDYLTRGSVCGWFDGRFEWGPRALGARSIIADPTRNDMKDIVNAKIKFREAFRPFAPSALMEKVGDYFELPNAADHYPARFMLYVVPVKGDKLPAITHVDGTGRVQGVMKEHAPRYHRLIERFGQASGVPVILNTSFNLKGEPIVETPANAFNTFMKSGMDALILGRYVVTKTDTSTVAKSTTVSMAATGAK